MSRTYHCWENMKQRCNNPNHPSYKNYGGRGITYCAEWEYYKNFRRDMGVAPLGLTLERRNNDEGYNKNNCYWGTWNEQAQNRRPQDHSRRPRTGLGIRKRGARWQAYINVKGEQLNLGSFSTEDAARTARKVAEARYGPASL